MKILIDTHIFLWALSAPDKLSSKRKFQLELASNEVFLSAMSIAELMIKSSLGKLEINFNPVEMAKQMGIELLAFSGEEALLLENIPFHHRDPFDRMIICQAITYKLKLMSDDAQFKYYDCVLI
ncbi:MAG: PIN domain nuclease [Methylophaga sp.]|nr:MAG: PIN domain nuclease [Methylophaga sp.]